MPRSHGNGELEKSLLAMQQAQTNMLQALTNEAQNQTALLARISELDAENFATFPAHREAADSSGSNSC
jgi:hypothetical protein